MKLKKECPFCKTKYYAFKYNSCPNCDDINFDTIDSIQIMDIENAYRIEKEEEFDNVLSEYMSQKDGWTHFETRTIEYEIEDGNNYTFLIVYKSGFKEIRKYHSSSIFVEKLIKHPAFKDEI